ncbi:MAG: superoxide dismutase, Ni [Candidatus Omnitrophica bacterium]|nr:superoxide dismutase, Ni [Candidatus Omnitrophota bacterium]
MYKKLKIFITVFLMVFAIHSSAYAHCEIPCGIYNDQQRVEMIKEHITTVEKSMKMINQLSKESPVDYNQLIRWVDNKEAHAIKIQDIVFQYFMTQRIKPAEADSKTLQDKYSRELQLLHQLAREAMKSKQTTSLSHVQNMRDLIKSFSLIYFKEKGVTP